MRDDSTVALNRKARHEFTIDDTFEAGLVLTGTEIKSIRAGKANIANAYARIERGEAWLDRRRHRAVRAGESVQPRPQADAQAAAPPQADRRAAGTSEGQGPDDRAAAPVHHPRQGQDRAGSRARQAAPRQAPRHRGPRLEAGHRSPARRHPARPLAATNGTPVRISRSAPSIAAGTDRGAGTGSGSGAAAFTRANSTTPDGRRRPRTGAAPTSRPRPRAGAARS